MKNWIARAWCSPLAWASHVGEALARTDGRRASLQSPVISQSSASKSITACQSIIQAGPDREATRAGLLRVRPPSFDVVRRLTIIAASIARPVGESFDIPDLSGCDFSVPVILPWLRGAEHPQGNAAHRSENPLCQARGSFAQIVDVPAGSVGLVLHTLAL
jgi:hypothetical protein